MTLSNPPPNSDLQEYERDDAVIAAAMKRSLVVIGLVVVLVGVGLAIGLRPQPAAVIEAVKVGESKKRETAQIEIPPMQFTDITTSAGLKFIHENGAYGDKLLPETMGGGCAFFDYDNDGDQDILFVNSQRWPWDPRQEFKDQPQPPGVVVYRNEGDCKFTDVTNELGFGNFSFYGQGVACGDYDNDGDVDLFFTAVGKSRLFRNDDKKFVEVTDEAGVGGDTAQWGTSTGWFDYDNDGDLDLFVCKYVEWTKEFDLAQKFTLIGGGRGYGRPQPFNGTFPSLFRNDGNGKFSDVSKEAGLHILNEASQVPVAKSLGVTFADFDADGSLDIVIANDTVQNFLLHNLGNGKFEEIGALSGVAFDLDGNARGAMGLDTAWFRNNTAVGVGIGNFSNEMTALYVAKSKDLQFRDEAVSNGLGPKTRLELTFGVLFADFDLDGRLDYFGANGHLENEINKVQQSQHYEQPPHLFWNCGPEHPTEFEQVPSAKCGDEFLKPIVGRGATYADIDNDGDLDLLIAACGSAPRLLRNDRPEGNHWIRLRLAGGKPDSKLTRDAIGSLVEVHRDGTIQRRLVMPTRSYLSQVELPVTFGLGRSTEITKVVIRWPNGDVQELTGLEIDKLHSIAP